MQYSCGYLYDILVLPPISKDARTTEQNHDNGSQLGGQSNPSHTSDSQLNNATDVPTTPNLSTPVFDISELFMSAIDQPGIDRTELSADMFWPMEGSTRGDLMNIDSTISSHNDKPSSSMMRAWGYPQVMAYVRSIPKSVTEERYELYLNCFHHRWPIIHIPSFEKEDNASALSASVEMIGAWLDGSHSSKSLALTLHGRLTNHIFQRMVFLHLPK